MAEPLHCLTCKNAVFKWSQQCQATFDELNRRLVAPPVLAYLNFDVDFVLETDASYLGLGALLSQRQEDGKVHPIAYYSHGLSGAEKNYGITDLDTLVVVWGISYFHYYLYGHCIRTTLQLRLC